MKESEAKYRDLFESAYDVVFLVDEAGNLLDINRRGEILTGYSRSELLQMNLFRELIVPEDRPTIRQVLQDVAQGEERLYEVRWQTKDKHIIHFEGATTSRVSASGKFISTHCTLRDITQRKQAEAELVRHAQEMTALYEVSLEISSQPDDLSTLLRAIVKRAVGLLGTRSGGLFLMNPDNETLELVAGHNQPDNYLGVKLRIGQGLSGRVVHQGEPLVIADYRHWEGQLDSDLAGPIGRILSVPLKRGERVIGVLNVFDDDKTGEFEADDIRLLNLFAAQAAMAIESARLLEGERVAREQAETLARVATRLNAQLDFQTIINAICEETAHALNVPAAAVSLYDPAHEAHVLTAAFGLPPEFRKHYPPIPLALHEAYVQQKGSLFILQDMKARADQPYADLFARYNIRTNVGISLIREEQPVGTLNIYTLGEPRTFDDADLTLLQGLADQATQAVANARLHEEVRRSARDQAALIQVMRMAASTLELEPMLASVAEAAARALAATRCVVLLGGAEVAQLSLQGGYDRRSEAEEFQLGWQVSRETMPHLWQVLGSEKPVLLHDTATEVTDEALRTRLQRQGVASLLIVPIMIRDEAVGVLNIGKASDDYPFSEQHLPLAQAIADQAAVAIQNARLYKAERKVRERLQILSQRLVEVQEAERRHLAQELHDEIGQVLTAVKLNLQALERLPENVPLASHLEDSIGVVEQALQKVRNLSLNLRPSMLDDFGLAAALRWYVDRQARLADFDMTLEADPLGTRPSSTIETACFRVAQEALTNTVRHAQAQRVWVELRQHNAELHLVIRDDGVGFDVTAALERATQGESLGFLSMQERVELNGGQLEIDSAPGRGTEIRVRFPLPATRSDKPPGSEP